MLGSVKQLILRLIDPNHYSSEAYVAYLRRGGGDDRAAVVEDMMALPRKYASFEEFKEKVLDREDTK